MPELICTSVYTLPVCTQIPRKKRKDALTLTFEKKARRVARGREVLGERGRAQRYVLKTVTSTNQYQSENLGR